MARWLPIASEVHPAHLRPPPRRGRGRRGVAVSGAAMPTCEARLINADGSEAEISGNGTRCVAAYLCPKQAKETVDDPHRRRREDLHADRRAAETAIEFETAMGEPEVDAEIRRSNCRLAKCAAFRFRWGTALRRVCRASSGRTGRPRRRKSSATAIFKQGINVELVMIQDKIEYRSPFLRARSRRDAVFRHRFVRGRRGCDRERASASRR